MSMSISIVRSSKPQKNSKSGSKSKGLIAGGPECPLVRAGSCQCHGRAADAHAPRWRPLLCLSNPPAPRRLPSILRAPATSIILEEFQFRAGD
jgi:hypothetical protein